MLRFKFLNLYGSQNEQNPSTYTYAHIFLMQYKYSLRLTFTSCEIERVIPKDILSPRIFQRVSLIALIVPLYCSPAPHKTQSSARNWWVVEREGEKIVMSIRNRW
jgi:hypothetical protein